MNKNYFKLILNKLGITNDLKGYDYILDSMEILEKQKIHTEINTIYEMIYKKEKKAKTIRSIETAITKAIEEAYNKNIIMQKIYEKVPSNADFIYNLFFKKDKYEKMLK